MREDFFSTLRVCVCKVLLCPARWRERKRGGEGKNGGTRSATEAFFRRALTLSHFSFDFQAPPGRPLAALSSSFPLPFPEDETA